MTNTADSTIDAIVAKQREFFKSGATLDPKWRKARLQDFLKAIEKWEKPLADALWEDLHKSYKEAYLTEISLVKYLSGICYIFASDLDAGKRDESVCTGDQQLRFV